MYEELFSRFTTETTSSLEDPDIHLSYTDRKRLEEGSYAAVAKEKLPILKRRSWWIKIYAVVAAMLLAAGALLTGLFGVEEAPSDWRLEEFTFLLFLAFCMGVAALGGLWRMLRLEKQRLLCELVVAYRDADAAEKVDE